MTIDDAAVTARRDRTANARAARSRAAEEGWADRLRGRGWTVVRPEIGASLRAHGPEHSDDSCGWCAGYRAALGDVLEPAPTDG